MPYFPLNSNYNAQIGQHIVQTVSHYTTLVITLNNFSIQRKSIDVDFTNFLFETPCNHRHLLVLPLGRTLQKNFLSLSIQNAFECFLCSLFHCYWFYLQKFSKIYNIFYKKLTKKCLPLFCAKRAVNPCKPVNLETMMMMMDLGWIL